MKRLLSLLLLTSAGCFHQAAETEQLVAIQIQDRNGLTETISNGDRIETYESVNYLANQPYKKVLRVFKKEGKNHSKITTYHPNGSICQYLEADEMRAHGAYKEWHPNGQLKIEAQVIGGPADITPGAQQDWLFEGTSQVWDEQGNLLAQILYHKGVLEGHSLYYSPSGHLEKDLQFHNNVLEGDTFEFFPNGQIKSRNCFRRGSKDGQSIGYFQSGQPVWIEDYSDGLLLKATYYTPDGTQIAEVDNGGGFQAVFENNFLSALVEYKFGHPEGLVKQYSPNGEVQRMYTLKNGQKQGEEIEFYLSRETEQSGSPLKKLSINWKENAVHGCVKTWYNNGQLESQREYCRNQKMGPALGWYRNGSIMLVEEYEEDRLIKGQYYKINQNEPVSSVVNGNGVAALYDSDGLFLRKVIYMKGKPVDPED